jgi:hypothetical protein
MDEVLLRYMVQRSVALKICNDEVLEALDFFLIAAGKNAAGQISPVAF